MKAQNAAVLPTDVYLSFVSSLFGNRGTLWTGVVVHVVWCLLVYHHTGSRFYVFLALTFAAVFFYRMYWFRRFDLADKSAMSRTVIAGWERKYLSGATMAASLLGIASGYALLVVQDSFAAFTCIAMTLGSMMSVVGRNYGSSRAVDLQTLGCCAPIVIACLVSGDLHLALMSLLLIPFGLTTRSMANGVREFLYENVLATRETREIADRFDIALTTMAHGLIMLDSECRIQVINRRAHELLGLDGDKNLEGHNLIAVLSESRNAAPTDIRTRIQRLADGKLDRAQLQIGPETYLEFSATSRDDGVVVLIFEDVTARVAAENQVLQMVRFDSLTGLPSRDHFVALARDLIAQDDKGLAALVLLDIQGFKHVNDLRGHVMGDRLLQAVAERLRDVAGSETLAGRLVGDEFVLVLTGTDGREALEERVRQCHARMQGGYKLGDTRLPIFANGACIVGPASDFDMEAWLIKADLAMNDAKSKGNGALTLFQPEMDARYVEDQKLKTDLRLAIEEKALHVVYQPMYRPDGSAAECVEALVRWKHPDKGLIGPNIFIPVAEDMGLISSITRFVIEQACRDCASWPRPLPVSINLSVQDLECPAIVDDLIAALERYQLDASSVHVEVTESSFIAEPTGVVALLSQLRAHGVTVAIDDFGTGFSSLSYLNSLPLDIVKLDRAFIRDIGSDERRLSLLRGIVDLSRNLGLKIVIEGVETSDQLALINEHNLADLVQGFIFSQPIPADAVSVLSATEAAPVEASPVATRKARNVRGHSL
jgi:diguanylate cyclase (GGDEF)-like protein